MVAEGEPAGCDPARGECVAIACGGAEVVVAPHVGGAIAAFRWRGSDVLRPAEPGALGRGDVRGLACYPLVPYSNRIAGACLQWGGTTWPLARNFGAHPHSIHGLGWQRAWQVIEHDATRVRLQLAHGAATAEERADWPWAFVAEQALGVATAGAGVVLTATLTITSEAREPFPFGLGWHPYFPCDAATLLGFRAAGVWLNDATQLPVERVAVPSAWCFDPPAPVEGVALDQVFDGWPGTATLEDPGQRRHVRIDADEACRHLVVYAPPGRGFVAVEPVTHQTDAFNRAAAGAPDTGTRILAPGQSFSCTMRLTVHPLD
jgi:aldose 1-epimerase